MWKCACGNLCSDDSNFCEKCGGKKSVADHGTTDNNLLWFYSDAGNRVGPLSIDAIRTAINEGKIVSDTSVWQQGFSDWKKAGQTVLKQYLCLAVPPVDKNSINDKWAWCLATIPICANIIIFELGQANIFHMDSTLITITVIILNCLFIALDVRYLKKAGHNLNKWMYLGFLLVPIYLFIRAAKINKRYGPAIVWCVLFFLQYLPIW